MELIIGSAFWLVVYLVWYIRVYPDRARKWLPIQINNFNWLRRNKQPRPKIKTAKTTSKDYTSLVNLVETTVAQRSFGSSDAAAMVMAVKQLMIIEPPSGQIWEAFALDSLETASIVCDDCGVLVEKKVKKTGVKINCPKCGKWLALKNSKIMIFDPTRADLEDWEK